MLWLTKAIFASTLGVPTIETHEHGVTISIVSQVEERIRVRSIEKGCLYIISGSSFVAQGVQTSEDSRLRFIQKKNRDDEAQLLIGLTEKWDCRKPSYRDKVFILQIGTVQESTSLKEEATEEVPIAPVVQQRSKKKNNDYVIALDAGHGGWDAGAVGSTGLREADVVLSISSLLQERLQQKGFQVLMIREEDEFVPLKERAQKANRANADLFLSIHANAAPTSSLYGVETFSMDTASDEGARKVAKRENSLVRMDKQRLDSLQGSLSMQGSMRLSKMLARLVQKNVMEQIHTEYDTIQTRDLGAKTALFYVLVYTKMPSILFEASFLSNPSDERQLRTPHFQSVLVDGLVKSVEEYIVLQE